MSKRLLILGLALLLVIPAGYGHQRPGNTPRPSNSGGYSNRDLGLAIFGGILKAMLNDSRRRSQSPRNTPTPRQPKVPKQPKLPDLPIIDPNDFDGKLLTGDNPFGDIDPQFQWTNSGGRGNDNLDFRNMRQEMNPPSKAMSDEVHPLDYRDIDWSSPNALNQAREIDAQLLNHQASVIAGIENTLLALKYAGKAAQLGLGFCTGAGVPSLMAQTAAAGVGGFGEQLSSDMAEGKSLGTAVKNATIKGTVDAVTAGGIGKVTGVLAPGLQQGVGNVVGFVAGEGVSAGTAAQLSGQASKRSFTPHGASYQGWSGPGMNK